MSNDFNFEELPPPDDGLASVRRRAHSIAVRARIKQMAQTLVATLALCVALLATGLFSGTSAQFADSDLRTTSEATADAGVAAPSAATPSPALNSQLDTKNVDFTLSLSLVSAVLGMAVLGAALFLLLHGIRSESKVKPRLLGLALFAIGVGMTFVGLVKIFS